MLIGANPSLSGPIKQEFAGFACNICHAAVSDQEGNAILHVGVNDDVSCLERANADHWGQTRGSVAVPLRRLGNVLTEYRIPMDFDVLSLDIEGEDIKVLNDLIVHTAYRPIYVIIEAFVRIQNQEP